MTYPSGHEPLADALVIGCGAPQAGDTESLCSGRYFPDGLASLEVGEHDLCDEGEGGR